MKGWERIKPALFLALIHNGAATVDTITGTMLPITARHFTQSATVIGFMVAFNRLFGFLVQPYVASLSDQRRGRWGRRRPFLLWGIPLTMLCVVLLGLMPGLVPLDAQGSLWALSIVFVVNMAMQAFLDVNYGVLEPLYGDTFKGPEWGPAIQWRFGISLIVGIVMSYWLIPAADHNEFIPYLGTGVLLLAGWMVACFGLQENPSLPLAPQVRYRPWTPLLGLREKATARLALIASMVFGGWAVGNMLGSLFITETLGLSKTQMGHLGLYCTAVSILITYPSGRLIAHFGPRAMLKACLSIGVISSVLSTFFVNNLVWLYISATLGVTSTVFQFMAITPFIFNSIPSERRGEIYGTVQASRAAAATLLTLAGGYAASLFSSYRACFALSGLIALIGLWFIFLPPGTFASHLSPAEEEKHS